MDSYIRARTCARNDDDIPFIIIFFFFVVHSPSPTIVRVRFDAEPRAGFGMI